MKFELISPQYEDQIAEIIRDTLRSYKLDIPGTAYYDPELDSLSRYYKRKGRAYYVLLENGAVIGGIGLAEFEEFPDSCELQKLYLSESARGRGLGYEMIRFIEKQAGLLGYHGIYLETHTNLKAAIHEYEKSGYREIERPSTVVHTTMNKFYWKDLSLYDR